MLYLAEHRIHLLVQLLFFHDIYKASLSIDKDFLLAQSH